ncbi:MAG: sulfatase-like hydrolase/transferase [Aestuariivita sp.]|nr:sulfatase-like hydrolase/transferase [Aestuariivita sp.]
MNILWFMCDQLRYDYLGCAGHPHIRTPNFDSVAAKGVRFNHAYCQSPKCGPSRMSAYTGRYVRSHGASTNFAALRVGEPTLGDHLITVGVDPVLIGKTHMNADVEGMKRLGIDEGSDIGIRTAECGFIPYVRDDGLHPHVGKDDPDYFEYVRSHGYEADNPWADLANAAEDENGNVVSGWFMRHARKPARIPAHLSESAYITDRTLQFMQGTLKDRPWVAHVSYIKPHWPFIAPAPYNDMYDSSQVLPAVREDHELAPRNSVVRSFQNEKYSTAFHRQEVRDTVIPTYMGLITQIDDEIGRILDYLKESGQDKDTMIILSSDHGDYLGDHWLSEKQLFHDPSVRVPLIIYDPRDEANKTRGTISDTLVELIDVAPTILEVYSGTPLPHIFEGESLIPALHSGSNTLRDYVVSECDYSEDNARRDLKHGPRECKIRMIADKRWKLVQYEKDYPQLFDRLNDPNELTDIAIEREHQDVLLDMHNKLFEWARNPKANICTSDTRITQSDEAWKFYDSRALAGFPIGYWSEDEFEREVKARSAFLKKKCEEIKEP